MSSHIPETRLMELGLDPSIEPTEAESTHLSECDGCSALLRQESELTDALAAIPRAEVPPGFVEATSARFQEARERKRAGAMSLVWQSVFALSLCASFGMLVVAFIIFPLPFIEVVVSVARIFSAITTALAVVAKTPALAAFILAYATATLLVCTGLVGGVTKMVRARRPS